MANKKIYAIASITLIILFLSFSMVSASWFENFWNKITGKAIGITSCPAGITAYDETNEQIPSAGNIKEIKLIKMQNQTFIKMEMLGSYVYLQNQFAFLFFDVDKNSATGQYWGGIGAETKLSWALSSDKVGINQFNSVGEVINYSEYPLYYYNKSYLFLIPSYFITTNALFYFEISGDNPWSDAGHVEDLTFTTENYQIAQPISPFVSNYSSYFRNISNKIYRNLPINQSLTLQNNVFLGSSAEYISLNGNQLKLIPTYDKYRGEIFGFLSLDSCGILTQNSNTYYIPGDSFNGRYVDFVIPGEFIPSTSHSPESNYNNSLKYLTETTNGIKIRDAGFNVLRQLTGVNLLGIIFMFDYNVGGGASSNQEIIKNGPFAFENDGVPEFGGDFHEIGHYHTLQNIHFTNLYLDSMYSEGFANILAHYTKESLVNNYLKYNLTESDKNLLIADRAHWINTFECIDKLKNDKNFSDFLLRGDGCIIQQIAINLSRQYYGNLEPIERLMKLYSPNSSLVLLNTKYISNEEHTIFIASISASLKQDMRDYFRELNWPINDSLFEDFYYQFRIQLASETTCNLSSFRCSPVFNAIDKCVFYDDKVQWVLQNYCNNNSICNNSACVPIKPKYILTCQKSLKYYKSWHTNACSSYACGKDKYLSCEKRWLGKYYYREVCQSLINYNTACSETSTCGSDKEIKRITC